MPTLTRYDVDVSGGEFETAGGPFYRCEEADRLIQALREELERLSKDYDVLLALRQAEVGPLRRQLASAERAVEQWRAVATTRPSTDAADGGAHPEANYAVDPVPTSEPQESLRAYRLKIEELTAEVGALRRALDAAQQVEQQWRQDVVGHEFDPVYTRALDDCADELAEALAARAPQDPA